ncbi:MAG TPA: hypothetical protein VM325_03465 [Alphaproteobacteria bacterium]|nr:hypothetical protein [Alphaproteobacteria bacterium]
MARPNDTPPTALAKVEAALEAVGLTPRGTFHPEPADNVPALPDGSRAGTLVLAGNVGPAMWTAFADTDRTGTEALDRWSGDVLGSIAGRFGGTAHLPGGPPYLPFIRWAQRAGPVRPSAIGMLIHPDFGLWHAYRGALALPDRLDLPPPDDRPRACDTCADKPCLTTCPVGAFAPEGYDVPSCVDYLETTSGNSCSRQGCAARRACPVGRDYHYAPEQAAFHMAAFLRANRKH